jgi:hypothetical protein
MCDPRNGSGAPQRAFCGCHKKEKAERAGGTLGPVGMALTPF